MRKVLEATVIRSTLGGEAWNMPYGPLTVALFQGDPGEYGTPTNEITGHGYVRQPISFTITTTNTTSLAVNTNQIEFPVATTAYGAAVTHVGIYTDTVLIWVGLCNPAQTIGQNGQFVIKAQTLTVTLD